MKEFSAEEIKKLKSLRVNIEEAKNWSRNENESIYNDEKFIMEMIDAGIKVNSSFLGEKLNDDIEFVKKLIDRGVKINLRDLGKTIRSNKEYIIYLVDKGIKINFSALHNNLQNDKELVKEVLNRGHKIVFAQLGQKLRGSKEIVRELMDKGVKITFEDLGEDLRNDKEFVKELMDKDVRIIFKDLGEDLRNDKELVKELMDKGVKITFYWLGEDLRNDEKFVKELMDKGVKITFSSLGKDLRNDEKFVKELMDKGVEIIFSSLGKDLRNDEKFVKELMSKGILIEFSSLGEDLRNNEKFVKELMDKGVEIIFSSLGEDLRNDLNFIRLLLDKGVDIRFGQLGENIRDDVSSLRKLIDEGMEIDGDGIGKTAMDDEEFVLELIDSGIKFDVINLGNNLINNKEFIRKLMAKGVEIKFGHLMALRDDAEFVKEVMAKGININFEDLGKKLKNNSEFIKELWEKGVVICLNMLGEDVRNNNEIMKMIISNSLYNIEYLGEGLKSDESIFDIALSMALSKKDLELLKNIYIGQDDFLARIEEKYKKIFWYLGLSEQEKMQMYINDPTTMNSIQDDYVMMLRLIKEKPEMYRYASKRLKGKNDFNEEAVKLGVSKELIELEQKRMLEEKEKNKEEKRKNIETKKEEQKKVKLEELRREYEKLGDNHPNIVLVNNFLQSGMSQVRFCEKNNISINDLKVILEEVSEVYPELGKQVEAYNKHSSAKYLGSIEQIALALLNGELDIFEFAHKNKGKIKIENIINNTKGEERKKLQIIVLEAIASGKFSMKDYCRVFSENYDYKTTLDSVNRFIKQARSDNKDIQGKNNPIVLASKQLYTLKKYETPYNAKRFLGEKIGFKKSEDAPLELHEITESHLEYAKKLLEANDEYICYSTMNSAIMKIIKGEVTFEQIDNLLKENESAKEVVDISQKADMQSEEKKEKLNQSEEVDEKQLEIQRFLENTRLLAEIDKQLELAIKENDQVEVARLESKRKTKAKEIQEYLNR